MSVIVIYTKPDCPHCARAKSLLKAADLPFEEHDVTQAESIAAESVYLSGITTVPQVFIGSHHIGGADALEALSEESLGTLVEAAKDTTPHLPDPSTVADGAQDMPLSDHLPESDGTHSDEPTEWPVLRMYKEFFGFWPNCFYFMHHWPEVYKQFIYCHNAISVGGGRDTLGGPGVGVVAWGSSNAHGCNYCKVHSVATMGEKSLGIPEALDKARSGKAGLLSPIKDFEVALADLAAHATLNTVTDADFAAVRDGAAHKGLIKHPDADKAIEYTAMISGSFGFLNVYNDLTGVEIEPHWAEQADGVGIEAGRHGVKSDRAPTNLDHDLPEGGPSMSELQDQYREVIAGAGGVEAYAADTLGHFPDWIARWPETGRALHLYFYSETMQDRPHTLIPSELRHLMAFVSAIEKGHAALATEEAALALNASDDPQETAARLKDAYGTAKSFEAGQDRGPGRFSERERAALVLAWLSAQVPLATPRRFVAPVIETHTPEEVVHLISVCAMASLVQRTAAVLQVRASAAARQLVGAHGIQTDPIVVKATPRTDMHQPADTSSGGNDDE